jgi:hypothetical protein
VSRRDIQELLDRRAAVHGQLVISHITFIEECLSKVSILSEKLMPVVIAVRKELGLPLNEETYREVMRELRERQRADAGVLLRELRAFVDEENAMIRQG